MKRSLEKRYLLENKGKGTQAIFINGLPFQASSTLAFLSCEN